MPYDIKPVVKTGNTTQSTKEWLMKKVSEKKSVKKLNAREKGSKTAPKNKAKSLTSKEKAASRKAAPKNGNGKKPAVKKTVASGIKKQYLKSNGSCNVTFSLPKEAVPGAQVVTIVGDFNNWNTTGTPMKKLRNGSFQLTMKLQRDREYRFRYLIDATRWENDWCADAYLPNEFGCDDSLVRV